MVERLEFSFHFLEDGQTKINFEEEMKKHFFYFCQMFQDSDFEKLNSQMNFLFTQIRPIAVNIVDAFDISGLVISF